MQRAPKTPVTTFLILANALGFVWEFVRMGTGLFGGDVTNAGLVGAGALYGNWIFATNEWWRLISGGFLHLGVLHIAVNMYSLYVLGRFVEAIAGSTRMATIYAISLIGSSLAVVCLAPNEVTVGASGAIFGLFGALFAIGLKLGKPGMDLVKANIGILVINLIFTFAVPGISVWGHVGGLLVGFIATYAIFFPPRIAHATVVDASTGRELESEIEPPNQHHTY